MRDTVTAISVTAESVQGGLVDNSKEAFIETKWSS